MDTAESQDPEGKVESGLLLSGFVRKNWGCFLYRMLNPTGRQYNDFVVPLV